MSPCPYVPGFIDPFYAKTTPKRSISMTENERFWACFRENWVYKFGHAGVGLSFAMGDCSCLVSRKDKYLPGHKDMSSN
jgi:hypothetical protein